MRDRGAHYYLLILWKRAWLLIFISLLGAAACGYVSYYVLAPQYETFTTLLVGRPNDYNEKLDYSEVLLNQKLVGTYREIARSKTVSAEVIRRLNLDLDYKDLRDMLDVILLGDTEIIKIQVKHRDASLSAMIANETALVFIENVKNLMRVDNIQIIDKAEIPALPISPTPIQNMVVGFTSTFMFMIFLIMLIAYINDKVLTQEDIINCVGIPVIGTIPKWFKTKNQSTSIYKDIIVNENPKSAYAEAFRILRTNIQFLRFNKESKCFIITSTISEEGKSTIASNLAYAIAQTNKKVILIDGDLRKPMLAKIFNLPEYCGLTNVLAANQDLDKAVYPIENNNLFVMPTGPIPLNPSELILCDKMKSLIQDFRNEYDYILIDTPPLGLVTDAADLATMADGTIIVCSIGKTKINNCNKAKRTLQNLNVKILGVVLNKAIFKKSSYYESTLY